MKAIDETPPSTSEALNIFIDWIEILANEPSPAPTIISPLGKIPRVPTPNENNLLTGPNLLNIALSIFISKTSPVLVPTYAKVSVGSMATQVNYLFMFPKLTSKDLILKEKIKIFIRWINKAT